MFGLCLFDAAQLDVNNSGNYEPTSWHHGFLHSVSGNTTSQHTVNKKQAITN